MGRIRESISIGTVKAPGAMVLLTVFVANVIIFIAATAVICVLMPSSATDYGFWGTMYHIVTMILGVGGIDNLVEDIGSASAALVISCVLTVIIGMVIFTGTIIGYMSTVISGFIKDADSGSKKLHISGHIVILNWNTRAAEMVNDLLYKGTKEKVVILVGSGKDDIYKEINERIVNTIESEERLAEETRAAGKEWTFPPLHDRLTVIVREGNTWSSKQLNDISVKKAKSVIILSDDASSDAAGMHQGDTDTIKTLVQVVQLTTEDDSVHGQKVIVEVMDNWTHSLVEAIIRHNMKQGTCNIVPVASSKILGLIFSQFAIMPELNFVYGRLFSNKGATFYSHRSDDLSLTDETFIPGFMKDHPKAVPLRVRQTGDTGSECYYMSDNEDDIGVIGNVPLNSGFRVSMNPDFEMGDRHVIILGHNSKVADIMEGFSAYNGEWKKKDGSDPLDITVIDNKAGLAGMDRYKKYPFVKNVISANVSEKDIICGILDDFIRTHRSGGCILILSDDTVDGNLVDADVLTYLILVQEILDKRLTEDPSFDVDGIDMVVEIVDPQNFDIMSQYSTKNIVISSRYISKIIMQIGERDQMFSFFTEMLTFDDPASGVQSKELYVKKAADLFTELPPPCTAADLIRAVYEASPDDNKAIVIGYFDGDGDMTMFKGDQTSIRVEFTGKEKVILYSNH